MANLDYQNLTDDERMQLARVSHYIDEYAGEVDYMRRNGTTLLDYVRTALRDAGKETMSGALVSGLEKLQGEYGEVYRSGV